MTEIAVRALLNRRVLVGACKTSLVVGTALNLINQPGIWRGVFDVGHGLLNYAVPWCVSAWSAARVIRMDR